METEIAFTIGRDLQKDGTPSWGEIVSAIEYAVPAIENIDSAIADWRIGILDAVADNASAGMYLLGDQPVSLGAYQLASMEAVLTCNWTCFEGTGQR